MAILSATIALICHAFALEARIFGGESGQNLSLLNVGSLVQPDDLYGDDYRGLAQSRLAAAAYRLCLRADQSGLRHIHCLTNISPTGNPPGMLVHIGLSLFSYATLIIAALYALQLAMDRLPAQE